MNPFAIGNLAVYHGKGVGLITNLETTDPRGNPCLICILDLKKSTAQVRVDHPNQTTIRTVMDQQELNEVYDILREQNVKPNQTTWNRRYRGYIQNINSGIPKEIAMVLRDLELLSIRKSLSFGESKIYSDAKELLVEEGAYTLIVPALQEFLLPLNSLKAKALIEHLHETLNQTLPDNAFDYPEQNIRLITEACPKVLQSECKKAIKELQSLSLPSLPPLEDETQCIETWSTLSQNILALEEEANKVLLRVVRKLISLYHEPRTEKPETQDDIFKVLRPWRKTPFVGIFEKIDFSKHKGYEPLKNVFLEKGIDGLDGMELTPVIQPLMELATHQILLELRNKLASIDINAAKKKSKSRAKHKNTTRAKSSLSVTTLEQDLETLVSTLDTFTFSPKSTDSIAEVHAQLYECFHQLENIVRSASLATIRQYLEEHLEEHRDKVTGQLDEIFKDAREQGAKEREEKAKKKGKKGDSDSDEDVDDDSDD